MVHTSDFRRRRAVSPQPPPHGYSPPIIRPYHHRMYQRPKDGTHEAPSSLSFDRRRRWLFVHQISLTVATTMPQWWEFSSHYNRHIPSDVSSAEQGILMKLRPLSSIVVSVVRSAADDDCLASTSPIAADRRSKIKVSVQQEGCWDAYCTTTSNSNSHIVESLYGTTGVQSSAEYIQIEYMYDV